MKNLRFWIVVGMLAAAAAVLGARGATDVLPDRDPLERMPHTIATWSGTDIPIDQETREVLGNGEFLSRVYVAKDTEQPIGLFIGYFPAQRTGVTMHSPKNCLPGAGWAFESSAYVDLKDANGIPHQVGEYVVSKGDSRQFVLYWYQAHGRSVANEYTAKFYLVLDAVRTNRTDGALIRVSAPITATGSAPLAKENTEAFAAQLLPILSRYVPN